MRCLVTGAAGFIGSTLSQKLLSLGHTVRGVDCFLDYYPRWIKESNLSRLSHPKFEFLQQDLLQANLSELLKNIDVIFHQAGQAGVRASWGDYFRTYIDNNILVTQKLLEAMKQGQADQKLVFASSSSVYGDAESYPTSELALPRPTSPYGVTKLAAEHLVTLYSTQFNLKTVSLRYFTVFGPRQRPDMAFTKFCYRALKGEEIQIFGDGLQSRDFTFVDDIVEANILAAEKGVPGKVYNIGGGTNATVNDVLEILLSEIGSLKVKNLDKVVGEARKTSADTNAAKRDLGFAPKVSLKDGLLAQLEWMRQILQSDTPYPS